jgi:CHAT domain-containing protein
MCQAQNESRGPALTSMFDRSWQIVCRDAAKPIGQIFALRSLGDVDQRLAASRPYQVTCTPDADVKIEGLRATQSQRCQIANVNVTYTVYKTRMGKVTYAAQGLAGYDSALRLGLRTIVADRTVPGTVAIATTGAGDPAGFANMVAGTLDPDNRLAEGYRRNNSGNYVEAAQFFDSLGEKVEDRRASGQQESAAQTQNRVHENLINRALQYSNLGEDEQADTLFNEAEKVATNDRVQFRLRRNFKAMHMLNQGLLDNALAELDRPLGSISEIAKDGGTGVFLDDLVAGEFNASAPNAANLGVKQEAKLTPNERAAIIDAQALQLRGTILRLQAKPSEARPLFDRAMTNAIEIREGRVATIARLRAQIMAESALAAEDQGNFGEAQNLLQGALTLLETTYPETTSMNGARARLAAFLARRGQKDAALTQYRAVIASTVANQASTTGLANQMKPYFDLLVDNAPNQPELVNDLFLATQTLIRPGAADSLETLARELEAGSGKPAQLFRQSITLSRDIERTRIDMARLTEAAGQDKSAAEALQALQKDLETLTLEQTVTQAALAEFPQFRAVAKRALDLSALRASLKPGEAYLKLAVAGTSVYAVYADGAGSSGYRLPLTPVQMKAKVDSLRETIATTVGGQVTTYGFDVALARALYIDLFGPVADRVATAKHLIFEPDGAMLSLPVNLLVTDQASVDTYLARVSNPDADEFDFRGVNWLGRKVVVSTAVSARSFVEARAAAPSAARNAYAGYGENAPRPSSVRASLASASGELDCSWPTVQWARPIPGTELRAAAGAFGGAGAIVSTKTAFSDTAIKSQNDLSNYRILHFATHGLVTAPRQGCPARPALVTSFGDRGSDGLLSFSEIFDLGIDADLVILSACDTAGTASRDATREAGVTRGGGSALDGLVRSFIGAGGRSVIASHWPLPEDFDATQRLVGGFFANSNTTVGEALQAAEISLMDDAATSHPYYWAGLAIIGDGSRPLSVAR